MQKNKRKFKIYIAAPLFSEMERKFNLEVRNFLHKCGFDAYLPQLDGGLCSDLIKKGVPEKEARKIIFMKNLEAIKNSNIFLFILDGRVPDEGACVELGIAFTLKKLCIGFKTDTRTLVYGKDNLIITGILGDKIARNFTELREILMKLKI